VELATECCDVVHRGHLRLRDLDLDLVADARPGVRQKFGLMKRLDAVDDTTAAAASFAVAPS